MKRLAQFLQTFTQSPSASSTRSGDRPSSRTPASPTPEKVSYRWIIQGKLAVGPIPNPTSLPQLQAAGFRSVLSLCGETEGKLPPEVPQVFNWMRLVLPDSHYAQQMQVESLAQAVAFVDDSIRTQGPIYVHCLAGMERSPTVCVSYLCVYQGLEVWEALNWVKQSNPRTSLTPPQVQVIQKLVQTYKQIPASA
jgi:atypical dual specificity phosphatase